MNFQKSIENVLLTYTVNLQGKSSHGHMSLAYF